MIAAASFCGIPDATWHTVLSTILHLLWFWLLVALVIGFAWKVRHDRKTERTLEAATVPGEADRHA